MKAIGETADSATGSPMQLLVPPDADSADTHRLLDRLREDYGYDVWTEYSGEHQTVYTLAPMEGDR